MGVGHPSHMTCKWTTDLSRKVSRRQIPSLDEFLLVSPRHLELGLRADALHGITGLEVTMIQK